MLKRIKRDDDAIVLREPAEDRTVAIFIAGSLAFWMAIAGFLYADGYFGVDRISADTPQTDVRGS